MAKLNPMVSVELDDEDQYDAIPAMPGMEKPRYPYCLRLSFDESILDKLDLDIKDFEVGGIIHLHALARITSVSQNAVEVNGEKKNCERAELQIEDLAVESEDQENREVGE